MIRFDKKKLSAQTALIHKTEFRVGFQDVDAAGIVFFARFFDYAHLAYEEFLRGAGCELSRILAQKEWAAPLRHAEADYLLPLRFGDLLSIRLVAAHVEESEITFAWLIVRVGSVVEEAVEERVSAIVQTVHTYVTLPDFKRCPVPQAIVDKLGAS